MKEREKITLIKQCCAICGPLSREEIESISERGEIPKGVVKRMALYRVVQQPDFPDLRKMYMKEGTARQLSETIMKRRAARTSMYATAIPVKERVMSAARYALLRDDAEEFLHCYELSSRREVLQGSPYMEHALFWDAVLGTRWMGAEYVPPGAARDEIESMLACRYCMQALPDELCVDTHCLPPLLKLGWEIFRENAPEENHVQETEPRHRREVLAVHAFRQLYTGNWGKAYSAFKELFGTREGLLYTVGEERSAILLLVALIVAVRANAQRRVVELWLRSARELLLCYLPTMDSKQADDLNAFFDTMDLWDSVENRGVNHTKIPTLRGPISRLPLAMGIQSILRNTGLQLSIRELNDAVIQADAMGLHLLAFYAASALLNVPRQTKNARENLSAILHRYKYAPMYERNEMKLHDVGVQWSRLSTLVEYVNTPPEYQLFWDIHTDQFGYIEALEPRLVNTKNNLIGQKLELDDIADTEVLNCQSGQDLIMASLARALKRRDVTGIVPLTEMVGHPRLRIASKATRHHIQLYTTRPLVVVEVKKGCVVLHMNRKQYYHLSVDETGDTASIPAFTPRMQALVEYLERGPVKLDISDPTYVSWLLLTLEQFFTLQGEIPENLRCFVISACQPIIEIEGVQERFHIKLCIEHGNDTDARSMPGCGNTALLVQTPHGSVCVRRDLAREREQIKLIANTVPELEHCINTGSLNDVISGRDHLLLTMQRLARIGVDIRWTGDQSKTLHLFELGKSNLELKATESQDGWFEIGARLRVDEHRVLQLTELLQAYHARIGNFLPIDSGCYLSTSSTLIDQLSILDRTTRLCKKGNLLPTAALPCLIQNWKGTNLPQNLKNYAAQLRHYDELTVPPLLRANLRSYQEAGYRWMMARVRSGFGCILADDMGLGKTLQMLAVLHACAAAGPALVVVPLTLCANWLEESARFAPKLRVISFSETRKGVQTRKPFAGEVMLASYGQVTANEAYFASVSWNLIVLDEAQTIKNPISNRTQTLCRLHAAARICMTGTPIENSLLDLWSLMHFLNPGLLGARKGFAHATTELVERVRYLVAPLVLRRTKADVLPQLPELTEMVIGVELNAEERSLYEAIRRSAVRRMDKQTQAISLLAELTRLRRLCCHGKLVLPDFTGESSKLQAMVALVQDLRAAGHRVLVFSQFTDVLDLAQIALHDKNISFERLDGNTSIPSRSKRIKSFQESDIQVFLISLKAGGYGINLTAADYVILLDPWWNPAVEAQAAGRSHRIGQRNPVTLCRLIARNTVEERVLHMHALKRSLAENVIREGSVSLETLQDILRNDK